MMRSIKTKNYIDQSATNISKLEVISIVAYKTIDDTMENFVYSNKATEFKK